MATRMILKNGDPQLRKHCHEVKDFNPRLHMLLDDMRQTLAESNGVGLAAPQVGVLRRAVIVLETNVPDGEEEYMIELINPTIVDTAAKSGVPINTMRMRLTPSPAAQAPQERASGSPCR